MNIIENPQNSGWQCPICGTNEKKAVTLIPIAGTQIGFTSESKVFHVSCIDLFFYPTKYSGSEKDMLVQMYDDKAVDRMNHEKEGGDND